MTIHAAARTTRSTRPTRSTGWVPVAPIALVDLPAIAGALRLVELADGPQLIAVHARKTASPVPVVVHIISAVAYALALGAGTQMLTQGVGKAIFGTSVTTDLCLGAARATELAVAEYIIRRSAGRRRPGRRSISRPIIEATAKVGSR